MAVTSNTPNDITKRMHIVENRVILETTLQSQVPMRRHLADRMNFYRVPGISLAVINDYQVEWAQGYGVKEARKPHPVMAETLFQAASISKPVTAAAVLRLVEQGVLNLDSDVNDSLVSWKIPKNGTWQPRVTLRQVLTHSAGINVGGFSGYQRDEEIPSLIQILVGDGPARTSCTMSGIQVTHVPGIQSIYSGGGYCIIQQLLIDVVGKPFPDILQELIFDPLSMTNSTFEQPLAQSKWGQAATGHYGYRSDTPVFGKWHVYPEMAAAGLWTTAEDIARFIVELLLSRRGQSNKILSAEMVNQMLTPHIDDRGLGFVSWDNGEIIEHDGGNEGFFCHLIAFTERGQGAVLLTNSDSSGGELMLEIYRSLTDVYNWPTLGWLDLSLKEQAAEVTPRVYDAYVGQYEVRADLRFMIRKINDALCLQMNGTKISDQSTLELYPTSETEFFAKVANVSVSFLLDDMGEVTELKFQQDGKEIVAKKVHNVQL